MADKNKITHSIGNITEIEKDEYTHKIIYGYIENKRVYMEILYYKTKIGLTFDNQYHVENLNDYSSFGKPLDYKVFYNGKECRKYTKSYGTSISISYELPTINKHEAMTLSLYSGNDLIADIPFFPVEQFSESLDGIPYAENNDIVLTADVQRRGSCVEVYIGALLPEDAYKDMHFFGNSKRFGFEETDVVLKDDNGTVYTSKAALSNPNRWEDDEAVLAQHWHFHQFEIPDGINRFTIIIPEIKYATGNNKGIKRKP